LALREVLKWGDPMLYKKSREVTVFDSRLHKLLDDLAQTMHELEGAGLAAVQVGILKRAAVVDIGDGLIELINPRVTEFSEKIVIESEGCLSYPGQYENVKRPYSVTIQGQDRNGDPVTVKGEGLLARALCHEIDHLNGIVFVDKALPGGRKIIKKTPAKFRQ
jgi:peptide deformylase